MNTNTNIKQDEQNTKDQIFMAAKDAAKMARRRGMMGYVLQQDSINAHQGVFIETSNNSGAITESGVEGETEN